MTPEQTGHTNHGHAGRGRRNPGHDHDHDYRSAGRRSLTIVLILLRCHMGIEIAGGILSGSLGLLAHATHMITDAVAIGLALFAMWIAERPATITRTFGYHRTEVLVVMFNALALWVLASWIFYEAYLRLGEHADGHGHEVEGVLMLAVASTGLVINLLAAWILYRSSRHSINVEGAFWHIMADLLGSVAVVISGVLTLAFGRDLVDRILSILIATLILVSSCRLAIKIFRVLLESVPAGLDMYRLCSALEDVEGVTLVHDVHAWTITTGYDALTAHVLVDPDYQGDVEPLLRRLRRISYQEFGIRHVTIQIDLSVADCTENHHVRHLEARTQAEA